MSNRLLDSHENSLAKTTSLLGRLAGGDNRRKEIGMGSRSDVWKGQSAGGSNPTLDRDGGTVDDENGVLISLMGCDLENTTDYVLGLALGTSLHLELDSARVRVYHGVNRIGWLDPASDKQVVDKLERGGLVTCALYSTGGLENGGYAIVECGL